MKTDSWRDDHKERIKSVKEVNDLFHSNLSKEFDYEINIPLHLAKKIKDSNEPSLRNQFLPHINELNQEYQENGIVDPIGDIENSKEKGIVHRYQNRILFFPTTICPVICRYCFRKNELSHQKDYLKGRLAILENYLKENIDINEVILSGGDPFMINDEKIRETLSVISKFSHIKYVRFHSRTPISLPSRMTNQLINVLRSFQNKFKIVIVLHVNHESEFDSLVDQTINKLSVFKLLSQSVLLKGVNDDSLQLESLFLKLDSLGVSPYYLHHPDKVKGAMHFDLPIERGLEIMKELRTMLPGWLIPRYIQDHPTGKVTLA